MRDTINIMSPAGSWESLMAALKGGANSVYFGVGKLNMRARSSRNFTLEDLDKIAATCNEKGVESYLTLNTVMYDQDMSLMQSIICKAKEAGITAIIASDLAVMSYTKKAGMPVHISTQANVSNIETVRFYADYADVIVLARELSLKQVASITSQIEKQQIKGPSGKLVSIELFAHGALCMAVSGKCYLSLHSHLASANRGECVQNCRRKYIVKDKDEDVELEIDNQYIMSAKDLCTIDFLDKIIEANVTVLKIEGRGRSADYVYTTSKCYREAADAILCGAYNKEEAARWKSQLATVFNRSFWGGYYLGRKMAEWTAAYGSQATKRKIYIGRGVKYFKKARAGEFRMETGALEVGNEILVTGPTTGVVQATVTELRVDDSPVNEVGKGDLFSLPVNEIIRPSDKLYKVVKA